MVLLDGAKRVRGRIEGLHLTDLDNTKSLACVPEADEDCLIDTTTPKN